jgi:hypothetical protein
VRLILVSIFCRAKNIIDLPKKRVGKYRRSGTPFVPSTDRLQLLLI